jgi:hypothetical protein
VTNQLSAPMSDESPRNDDPNAAARRRRALLWLVAAAALIAVVVVFVVIALTDEAAATQHTVGYTVTGNAPADITYYEAGDAQQVIPITAAGQRLPWSKTTTVSGDLAGVVLTAAVPAATPGTALSCTLSVDGKVVASVAGDNAEVRCPATR